MKKTNFERQKIQTSCRKVCTDVIISMFHRSRFVVKQIVICA
jgi:hypothetical protein